MQHDCMIAVPLSKRGTLTIPPEFRRKLGIDKMSNPMFLVEECDGGLFLQPAVAMPIQNLPRRKIPTRITQDKADTEPAKPASKGKRQ